MELYLQEKWEMLLKNRASEEKLVERLFPVGNTSHNYTDERTRIHNGYIKENAIKYIAFKILIIMPILPLQKGLKSSQAKEDCKFGGK